MLNQLVLPSSAKVCAPFSVWGGKNSTKVCPYCGAVISDVTSHALVNLAECGSDVLKTHLYFVEAKPNSSSLSGSVQKSRCYTA